MRSRWTVRSYDHVLGWSRCDQRVSVERVQRYADWAEPHSLASRHRLPAVDLSSAPSPVGGYVLAGGADSLHGCLRTLGALELPLDVYDATLEGKTTSMHEAMSEATLSQQ